MTNPYEVGKEFSSLIAASGFSFEEQNANLKLGSLIKDLGLKQNNEKTAISWLVGRPDFRQISCTRTEADARSIITSITAEAKKVFSVELSNYLEEFLSGFSGIAQTYKTAPTSSLTSFQSPIKTVRSSNTLQAPFYEISPGLLFALSYFTLGIYDFLWLYRHWRHFKRKAISQNDFFFESDKNIIPFWSATFFIFYLVGTARRIKGKLTESSKSSPRIYVWPTIGIVWFCSVISSPELLLSLSGQATATSNEWLPSGVLLLFLGLNALSPLFLAFLQAGANEANSSFTGSHKPWRMRTWDYIILVFGLLAFVGSLIP